LDIDEVLECLKKINASDLHLKDHFNLRAEERKNNLIPDVNSILSKILKDKPVSISKQNDITFKILYELNVDYDLAIIISKRTNNPISFNLITCFKVLSDRRKRE